MEFKNEYTNKSEVENLLFIDNSSLYALEQELLSFSVDEYRYHRKYAKAIERLGESELQLSIVTSTIMEEIYNADKSLPKSARGEIRKTKVPLDERYQTATRNYFRMKGVTKDLEGVIKSFASKGFKLQALFGVNQRQLKDGPVVTNGKVRLTDGKMKEAAKKLEY